MKLTIETLKKLIKEELNLLENEYGEEFNPRMKLPKDHEGDTTNGYLDYENEKNKPFYQSYVDQLKKFKYTIDLLIGAAVEAAKSQIQRGIRSQIYKDPSGDINWERIYKDAVEGDKGIIEDGDIKYHIKKAIMYNKRAEKKGKEHLPIPNYLHPRELINILVEEDPNDLNTEILKDVKRMFYFMKDLYQGKLVGYDEETIDLIKNDEGTFNQVFSSYDGPKPEGEDSQ